MRPPTLSPAQDHINPPAVAPAARKPGVPIRAGTEQGMVLIALSALYAMKVALYPALREARVSQSALAARLGKDEKEVRRLLDPGHASRTSNLELALRTVGKRVQVVVEDAE